jgi:rare lipoprotein A
MVCAALLVLSSCRKRARTAPALPPQAAAIETGIASWYGEPYHGRQTANGEIYDMDRWTAAHKTLPFGTWVDVENLTNGKHVTVRVNDRGPFVEGRIIDLSRAAAQHIGLIVPGTARVRLRVVTPPNDVPLANWYAVQVMSVTRRDEAERMQRRLRDERRLPVTLLETEGRGWRVLVGRESSQYEAALLAASLRSEFPQAFVVRQEDPSR